MLLLSRVNALPLRLFLSITSPSIILPNLLLPVILFLLRSSILFLFSFLAPPPSCQSAFRSGPSGKVPNSINPQEFRYRVQGPQVKARGVHWYRVQGPLVQGTGTTGTGYGGPLVQATGDHW
jgi:hypothetical protein